MNAVFFPNWSNALTGSNLPPQIIKSHVIAIRWFLSYLGRIHQPATVETARDFIDFAIKQKAPEPWMVDRWKAGIRWFFVNAPVRKPLRAEAEGENGDRRADGGEKGSEGGGPSAEGGARVDCHERAGKPSVPEEALLVEECDGKEGRVVRVPASEEEMSADAWVAATRRLIRVRHMALETERSYVPWAQDFLRFHKSASPA